MNYLTKLAVYVPRIEIIVPSLEDSVSCVQTTLKR